MSTTAVSSVCRLCSAQCGIIVDRDGEQIHRVRGNREDPVSQGYTCAKGRGLAEFHSRADRLDRPRLHGQDVSWDECFTDLDERLPAVVAEHGPGAVGRFSGTGDQADFLSTTVRGRVFGGLGTPQCYSTITVDIAPLFKATELVTGFSYETTPVWDPEGPPELCLVLGSNPVVSHGYWSGHLSNPVQRIRAFTQRGGQLWVLDPRRTETAALATTHLPVRPDSDVHVLGWLVRELLADGADPHELSAHVWPQDLDRLRAAVEPITIDVAAAHSGIDPGQLTALLVAIRRAGRIACISGTGLNFSRNAMVAEWLRWVLLIITGSLDRPDGMRMRTSELHPVDQWPAYEAAPAEGRSGPGPASRPELSSWLGEYPSISMVDEIEAGNLRALVVHGGNPLIALPDPDRTAAALSSLDVLVVVDVLDTEVAELATHVLPAAGLLEHADLAARDRVVYAPRVVPPAAERRPGWWIMARLGQSLGIDVFDDRLDLDAADDDDLLREVAQWMPIGFDELRASGVDGFRRPRRDGWVRERLLPDGRWRVAPPVLADRLEELLSAPEPSLKLVSKRLARSVNSVVYGAGDQPADTHPPLHVHPDDAEDRMIADGDLVEVVSEVGRVRARVQVDATIVPGSVSMTHGRAAANVARLVSATHEVDPLTGQPVMSGLSVILAPVPEAHAGASSASGPLQGS